MTDSLIKENNCFCQRVMWSSQHVALNYVKGLTDCIKLPVDIFFTRMQLFDLILKTATGHIEGATISYNLGPVIPTSVIFGEGACTADYTFSRCIP
jgi:hypothetical protein